MDSATAVQVKNVHVKRSLELSRYVKKLLHSVQGTDLGHFFTSTSGKGTAISVTFL